VGQSSVKVGQLSEKDKTVVAERIADCLRQIHPTKTAERVAADIGVPAATVQKWLERGSAPNNIATMKLLCAYGPEFACAVIPAPPAWLVRAAHDEGQRRIAAQIADLQAKLDGDAA